MKKLIIKIFPKSILLKAWLVAFRDCLRPVQESYSQCGEDKWINAQLPELNPAREIYVDVGANHPTRLSNTYQLYRRGLSGVVIEPNRSLLHMHKYTRSRDVQLSVGCGEGFDFLKFQHSQSHVLSGFESDDLKESDTVSSEFLAVVPLDSILKHFDGKEIALLSIDVEGFDIFVARGAVDSLKRTRYVIIEGDRQSSEIVEFFNGHGFELQESTKHNLIFKNQGL